MVTLKTANKTSEATYPGILARSLLRTPNLVHDNGVLAVCKNKNGAVRAEGLRANWFMQLDHRNIQH